MRKIIAVIGSMISDPADDAAVRVTMARLRYMKGLTHAEQDFYVHAWAGHARARADAQARPRLARVPAGSAR